MRGWLGLYALSVRLGLGYLARHGYLREAVVRVAIPLDPSRYVELPYAQRELRALPGERVLDLASPKLLAVALAREGAEVTSVDAFASEVETWQRLAGGESRLRLQVADGRALPFADASFDHAYSISVLEHIADDGDERALGELARVVRPGGRVVVTLPYAREYREDWRDRPAYGGEAVAGGRYFFQRWYDDVGLERLLASAPLRQGRRQVVRLQPNWNDLYVRTFPLLVPLGPFLGLLAREREGPGGDVVRLTLIREPR